MSQEAWESNDGWKIAAKANSLLLLVKMGEWIYRLKMAAEVEDYEEVSCVAKEMGKFCKEGL